MLPAQPRRRTDMAFRPPPAAHLPLPAQPPPVADALIGGPAPLPAGQAPPAIVDGNAAGIGMGAADSSDVIYIPRPNLVHGFVTPSQKRIVADLPWRNVREAAQASGIPTSSADDDWTVRDKLLIAAWAAETVRTSAHVRALASDVQHCVLAALGAEPTWAPPLVAPVPTLSMSLDQTLLIAPSHHHKSASWLIFHDATCGRLCKPPVFLPHPPMMIVPYEISFTLRYGRLRLFVPRRMCAHFPATYSIAFSPRWARSRHGRHPFKTPTPIVSYGFARRAPGLSTRH